MTTIYKEHFQKCKSVDCRCKWEEMKTPKDFRQKIFSSKEETFQAKVFLKYYLLILSENAKNHFL